MLVLTTSSPCRKLWLSNQPGLRPSRNTAKGVAVARGGVEAVEDCIPLGSIEARRRIGNRRDRKENWRDGIAGTRRHRPARPAHAAQDRRGDRRGGHRG